MNDNLIKNGVVQFSSNHHDNNDPGQHHYETRIVVVKILELWFEHSFLKYGETVELNRNDVFFMQLELLYIFIQK